MDAKQELPFFLANTIAIMPAFRQFSAVKWPGKVTFLVRTERPQKDREECLTALAGTGVS